MEWTDKLRTGIAQIDDQHRGIFQWFTELEGAADERRTLFAAYAVTRLNQYVREHFAIEESLLRESNYPHMAEHLAEHDSFRDSLRDLRNKALSDALVTEMIDLLRAWLTNHIAKSDMDYAKFLQQRDAKAGK